MFSSCIQFQMGWMEGVGQKLPKTHIGLLWAHNKTWGSSNTKKSLLPLTFIHLSHSKPNTIPFSTTRIFLQDFDDMHISVFTVTTMHPPLGLLCQCCIYTMIIRCWRRWIESDRVWIYPASSFFVLCWTLGNWTTEQRGIKPNHWHTILWAACAVSWGGGFS